MCRSGEPEMMKVMIDSSTGMAYWVPADAAVTVATSNMAPITPYRLVQPLLNPVVQPQPYITFTAGQMNNPPVSMQVNTTVFVRGIPWEATTQTVENHFKIYGSIETCHVIRHKDASTNKGIAFVKFHDAAAAHRAVQCNNPGVMDQREIYAEYARPRTTSSSSSSSSSSSAPMGQKIRHHGNYFNEYSAGTVTPSEAHVEQYGLQTPTSLVTSPNPATVFFTSPSSSQFCMNPSFVPGNSSTGYYMVNVGTPAGPTYPTAPANFGINPVIAVASPSPSWIVGSPSLLPFSNSYVSASGGHVVGYPYPGVQVVATDPAVWANPGEIYTFSRPPLSAANSWPQSYYNVYAQHLGTFVHQSNLGPSESSSYAVGSNPAQIVASLGLQQSWEIEAQESTTHHIRDIHRREEDHKLMQDGVAEEVGHDASPDAPFRSSCHTSGLDHGDRSSAQPRIMLRGSPESSDPDVDLQVNLRMTTSTRAPGNMEHEDIKTSEHEPDQEGSVRTDAIVPHNKSTPKTLCAQLCVETAGGMVADHGQDAEWPQLPSCAAELANLSLKKSHPAEVSRKSGKKIMK